MKSLSGFAPLELAPDLKRIYGKSGGEELFIINEFHRAKGFRKLHLEQAVIGSSLEILHGVFFPEPTFDLPIFGVDIVSVPEGVSAAIVDLSPVGNTLPNRINNELQGLKIPAFKNVREIPAWGDIFSKHVTFIRPNDSTENLLFLELVDKFLNILISYSYSVKPDLRESYVSFQRYEGQKYYCLQQKRNDKTRNVLAKTFSPAWADEYIEMVLFDYPDDING